MPRLVNRLPKYSSHKPSGQAKVRFNGKTVYLGKYGSPESKEAYARFIATIPKPIDPTKPTQPAPGVILMVGEAVVHYNDHASRYYAREGVPTGEHITIQCALRPLTKRFDSLPVTEFGPKKLKQVREDMIALGWTRYYCNKATAIIKRCFTWCASEELVPASVAVALTTVKGLQKNRTAAREKDPIGPVADEHVDATLPHVSDLVADIVRAMRLTGMRPGEAITMTAAEIDRTDPTCWICRPGHHKTAHKDKTRVIFIGARAQEIILPYIMKTTDGPLFPITRAALRRAIQRGCVQAKVPQWHPNQLRHTAATEFRSKFGLEAAQVLLGHSKADTTQVYAERDLKKAADVAPQNRLNLVSSYARDKGVMTLEGQPQSVGSYSSTLRDWSARFWSRNMPGKRSSTGRIACTPTGRSTNLYAFSPALQNALCDIMDSKASVAPAERAGTVMNAVVVHCTDFPDMGYAGGPLYWPSLVNAIVESWSKDPHKLIWSTFVRRCVQVYVDDLRQFHDACDPKKAEQHCVESGDEMAREWLFPKLRRTPLR